MTVSSILSRGVPAVDVSSQKFGPSGNKVYLNVEVPPVTVKVSVLLIFTVLLIELLPEITNRPLIVAKTAVEVS